MTALSSPAPTADSNQLRHGVACALVVGALALAVLVHPLAAVPAAAGAVAAWRTNRYQRPAQWYGIWWPNTLGYTLMGYAGVGVIYLLVWAFTAIVWFLVAAFLIGAVVTLKRIF